MPVPVSEAALRFVHPEAFLLLWLLLPLLAVWLLAGRARRRATRRFRGVDGAVTGSARNIRPLLACLTLLGYAALVVAVARPGWESQATTLERRGRDVVFVVDVSRSMLAEDLAPNRLERAKLAILDTLEQLSGDRVALVAFAGSAVVKSPLTFDYGFFRLAVQQLSVTSVARGGSLIGDALRTVRDQVFDERTVEYRDVLLITDGGDHDSFPAVAAEELGQRGVRLLAVGLGDDSAGQPIPLDTTADGQPAFVEHEGQMVLSQLDAGPAARRRRCHPRRPLHPRRNRQRRPGAALPGADRRRLRPVAGDRVGGAGSRTIPDLHRSRAAAPGAGLAAAGADGVAEDAAVAPAAPGIAQPFGALGSGPRARREPCGGSTVTP